MQKEYINSIVLIPPSEGKTDGGSFPGLDIQTMGLPSLSKKRRDLIEVLQSTMKSSQKSPVPQLNVRTTTANNSTSRTSVSKIRLPREGSLINRCKSSLRMIRNLVFFKPKNIWMAGVPLGWNE